MLHRYVEAVLLGKKDAKRISDFIYPLWMEVYTDEVTNGAEAVETVFHQWVDPLPICQKMDDGYQYFMFVEDGKDLAVLAVRALDDEVEMNKLYVSKQHQGKGIGTKAIEFAKQYGREHGCTVIRTNANSKNRNAINLYVKQGMVETERVHYEHDGAIYDLSTLKGSL